MRGDTWNAHDVSSIFYNSADLFSCQKKKKKYNKRKLTKENHWDLVIINFDACILEDLHSVPSSCRELITLVPN